MRSILTLFVALTAVQCCFGQPDRTVISLDGQWQIAEGVMGDAPKKFDHSIAVPGLLDLARPKFAEIGTTNSNKHREAFWYRRTFRVKQTIPSVALLKIQKAAYGAKVFLNGKCLGEHQPSFTPGYFDVQSVLHGSGAENELLIRVGATRDVLPKSFPDGFDFEKIRYIPGIFDSVELILSGTPNIVRVQVAPDIANGVARVQVCVSNAGPATTTALHFKIRKARSHKIVAESSTPTISLANNTAQTVDAEIKIPDCNLWSPENPFLYELETSTEADTTKTRFGMREFHFDRVTGHAYLNGRPYYLRGSNVTLYRFFEDAQCEDLPWSDRWVRRLHQTFKTMHWNSLRYCIGFPPERWYDIADEEGFLIEDEFPIWFGRNKWPADLKSAELVREYTDWMQERWNHPCVVIWDAQNETSTSETGKAIHEVRNLDLSQRPWDNGYGAPDGPNDEYEMHPYQNNKPLFTFPGLAQVAPKPENAWRKNAGDNPVIINEYGWLWLNRDGTPTTLTKRGYANLLGTNAAPAQRRHLYARYLSAKTEFWRSHRQVAGVLHFCGLGYSRPDGQTSDNFLDVRRLNFEPEFQQRVGDAFAPIGIMIDDFAEELAAATEHNFTVAAINDLSDDWSGKIRFRVLSGKRVVIEQTSTCNIPSLGRTGLAFAIKTPTQPGLYQFEATLIRKNEKPVSSIREIQIITNAPTSPVKL